MSSSGYDSSIIEQLKAFSYQEKDIKHAIDNVTDKSNINSIIEYIENHQNRLSKSLSSLNSFDPSRFSLIPKEDVHLVYGYIRTIQQLFPYQHTSFYIIPTSINKICCLFYSELMLPITWNTKYYTNDKLSIKDDNKLVCHDSKSGYAYISANIKPIVSGIHCFRVVSYSKSRNTIFFSFMRFSKDNEYKYHSFYSAQLYGTTTHGFTVYNGGNDGKGLHNPAVEYQLDMMINCEEKEIRIGFVKQHWKDKEGDQRRPWMDRLEIVHKNIPNWEWVPHFNLYDANSMMRIIQINPTLYRQQHDLADKLLKIEK